MSWLFELSPKRSFYGSYRWSSSSSSPVLSLLRLLLLSALCHLANSTPVLTCTSLPGLTGKFVEALDPRHVNDPLRSWTALSNDEVCMPMLPGVPLPTGEAADTHWTSDPPPTRIRLIARCVNCPNCSVTVPTGYTLFLVTANGGPLISPRNPGVEVYSVLVERLPSNVDDCIIQESDSDALRSFSKTSVLFVSISFIILMVISLAWLVFYYVQRFRYAHAKDRLQRRLFNAAKKALARIPTRQLRSGDRELDTDCPVCIDPYAVGDVVRTLPCRHIFHKTCIDPWLLEHRTCPMCKSDILKAFGYQVTVCGSGGSERASNVEAGGGSRAGRGRSGGSAGRRRGTADGAGTSTSSGVDRRGSNEVDSASSSSDSIAYPFPSGDLPDMHDYTPVASPQLVINNTQARSFAIIPLTVHSTKPPTITPQANIAPDAASATSPEPPPTASTTTADSSTTTLEDEPLRRKGSKASLAGKIVNLVQVRASTPEHGIRAATFRGRASLTGPGIDAEPTPIESVHDV